MEIARCEGIYLDSKQLLLLVASQGMETIRVPFLNLQQEFSQKDICETLFVLCRDHIMEVSDRSQDMESVLKPEVSEMISVILEAATELQIIPGDQLSCTVYCYIADRICCLEKVEREQDILRMRIMDPEQLLGLLEERGYLPEESGEKVDNTDSRILCDFRKYYRNGEAKDNSFSEMCCIEEAGEVCLVVSCEEKQEKIPYDKKRLLDFLTGGVAR